MQKQSSEKNQVESCKQKSEQLQDWYQSEQKFEPYAFLTASLLRDLIQQEESDEQQETGFDSLILKDIDLKTYIASIHKQTKFEPQCLIIALIYIDRYNLNCSDFQLRWVNVHKLLLVCLLLAAKFHDEVYYDNKTFEIGGGVNNVKLIELETKVFQKLEFNLFVQGEYYFEFLKSLDNAYLHQQVTSEQQLVEED